KSNAVTFLEETPVKDLSYTNHKIYFIENVKGKTEMYCLNPIDQKSIIEGKIIIKHHSFTPLLISPDNRKIFFYINENKQTYETENNIEVWDSKDKIEYKRNLLEGNPESRPKLVAWYPKLNKIFEINNNQHPSVYLTPDR